MQSIRTFLKTGGTEVLRGRHVIIYGPDHRENGQKRPYLAKVTMCEGSGLYHARDVATGAGIQFSTEYEHLGKILVLEAAEVKPVMDLVRFAGYDYVFELTRQARDAEGARV